MRKFAEGTEVTVEKTKAEIERTVQRFGATGFATAWNPTASAIMFEMKGRRVRFVLNLPEKKRFYSEKAFEAENRRLWRAMLLGIKAKLEVVNSGIASFEEEFLSHIVLPNGESVGQWMAPQLQQAYGLNKMPPLLGSGS